MCGADLKRGLNYYILDMVETHLRVTVVFDCALPKLRTQVTRMAYSEDRLQ